MESIDKLFIIKFWYKSDMIHILKRIITIAKDSDHAIAKLEKSTINFGGVNIVDIREINLQELRDDISYI